MKKNLKLVQKSTCQENANIFGLSLQEQLVLKTFTDTITPHENSNNPFDSIINNIDLYEHAKKLAVENPFLVAKVFEKIRKNPEILREINEPAYRHLKHVFPELNGSNYIAPISIVDPMNPLAAMPAALAVAVVAAATMFVGRAGFIGVV